MIYKSLAFLLFVSPLGAFGQILPVNHVTGLVAIMDSVNAPANLTPYDMQLVVRQWQKKLNNHAQLQKVFHYVEGEKSAEFYCSSGFARTKDHFTDIGTLAYSGGKKVLGQLINDISIGTVSFSLNYEIRQSKVVFEFTDLFFKWGNGGGVTGRFEDEKTSKPFAIGVTASNKKDWEYVKRDYVARFTILMQDLKGYFNSYNEAMPKDQISRITYQNYTQLQTGMTYDQVKQIIGGEGKEISNVTQTIMNKEITTLTIRWVDSLNQDKRISIVFRNGRLVIKQQENL